jgi:hypothetical protein
MDACDADRGRDDEDGDEDSDAEEDGDEDGNDDEGTEEDNTALGPPSSGALIVSGGNGASPLNWSDRCAVPISDVQETFSYGFEN